MLPEEIELMTKELALSLCTSLKDYPTQIAFIFDRIYLRHDNLAPERQFAVARQECGEKTAKKAETLHAHYMTLDKGDRREMRSNARSIFKSEFSKNNLDFMEYYYSSNNTIIHGVSFDGIVGDIKTLDDNARQTAKNREELMSSDLYKSGALDSIMAMGVSISFTPSYHSSSSSSSSSQERTTRAQTVASSQRVTSVTTYPPSVTIDGIQINLQKYIEARGISHVRSVRADNKWENVMFNDIVHESNEILSFAHPCHITSMTETPPSAVIDGVEIDLAAFANFKNRGDIFMLYNTGTAIRINGYEYNGHEMKRFAREQNANNSKKPKGFI